MVKQCEQCSGDFSSDAPTSRFCSAKCRKAAFKARQQVSGTSVERPGTAGTTVLAVEAELAAAGRAETYLGRAAVALARRVDESTAVMGFAALVKQLQSTMEAALAGADQAADSVDEIRARRDRKLAAG